MGKTGCPSLLPQNTRTERHVADQAAKSVVLMPVDARTRRTCPDTPCKRSHQRGQRRVGIRPCRRLPSRQDRARVSLEGSEALENVSARYLHARCRVARDCPCAYWRPERQSRCVISRAGHVTEPRTVVSHLKAPTRWSLPELPALIAGTTTSTAGAPPVVGYRQPSPREEPSVKERIIE
jgi:hypothetical protein